MEISGLNEAIDDFNQLSTNTQELIGKHSVPLDELFSDFFMQSHTSFSDFYSFLKSGGFSVTSSDDLDTISDEDLNKFIADNTPYNSLDEMIEEAAEEYAYKQLGI